MISSAAEAGSAQGTLLMLTAIVQHKHMSLLTADSHGGMDSTFAPGTNGTKWNERVAALSRFPIPWIDGPQKVLLKSPGV